MALKRKKKVTLTKPKDTSELATTTLSEAKERYSKIIENSRNTISVIEAKPHVRMIRYLLTKRFSPSLIRVELNNLSCSCPHEADLKLYYMAVIDPLVQKHGLGTVFSNYKGKLLQMDSSTSYKNKRASFAGDLLSFAFEFEDKRDLQINFLQFLKDLEIEELWQTELYKFYGTAGNFPTDKDGNKIFNLSFVKKTADKIVTSPKRYIVDKFICEGVPTNKIVEFCNKKMNMNLDLYDVNSYKKIFFNIQTHDIEEKIRALELESNSLKKQIKDIENDSSFSMGEKSLHKNTLEIRVSNINQNIKALNSWHSEMMISQTSAERYDYETMFKDMSLTLYQKFKVAATLPPVDSLDFMVKTTRAIATLHDKIQDIEKYNTGQSGFLGENDPYSNQEIIKLATKNTEDSLKEIQENSNKNLIDLGYEGLENVDPDEIAGADELYVSFSTEDE